MFAEMAPRIDDNSTVPLVVALLMKLMNLA